MGKIYIGISGWRYKPWRGVFYPAGLAQSRELEYAAQKLPTLELNGSFYSLQRPSSYAAWYEATPPGFVFSHKGNRYLTHILRLGEGIAPALANVMASGVFNLREKLGPFLCSCRPISALTPSGWSVSLHCSHATWNRHRRWPASTSHA